MLKIAIVASECNPIAKVGGLADVVGSLPKALEKVGLKPFIIIPAYGTIDKKKFPQKLAFGRLKVFFDKKEENFKVFQTKLPDSQNTKVYLIDHPILSSNGVYLSSAATADIKKEIKRFTFFSMATLRFLTQMDKFDLIHLNDWHTSLIPYLVKTEADFASFKKTATVLTIHNMGHAYQGISDISILKVLDLEPRNDLNLAWNARTGKIDYLEQGIRGADLVNTVSPSYAVEITTPEFCEGLCDVVAAKGERVWGILNGIDYQLFNPAKDAALWANYSVKNWQQGKKINKAKLQKAAGLVKDESAMLIGMVSRLDEQKGFDLILKAAPKLMAKACQMIILGTGRPKYAHAFTNFAKVYDGRFAYFDVFDPKLASRIYAGSDAFLMPSRFEPCGLGQMIAARYGTVPVVRNTGGLKDSIDDGQTGFKFTEYTTQALVAAVEKTLMYFAVPRHWGQIVQMAMTKDFSWEKSAKEYVRLYKEAIRLKSKIKKEKSK